MDRDVYSFILHLRDYENVTCFAATINIVDHILKHPKDRNVISVELATHIGIMSSQKDVCIYLTKYLTFVRNRLIELIYFIVLNYNDYRN